MNVDFDEQKNKFALIVGQAILNFGDIEDFTLLVLDYLQNGSVSTNSSSILFTGRVNSLINLLQGLDDSDAKSRMLQHLEDAKELSKIRNTIAHNPFLIEVYDYKDVKQRFPQLANYARKNDKISYYEIVKFSQQAELLAEKLHGVFLEMMSSKSCPQSE